MNILDKKITMSLWKTVMAFLFFTAFITLGVVTENIILSKNFIIVIKITTALLIGTITVVAVTKVLLNYKDSIVEFFKINTTKVIIILIVILIAILLSGCLYQVSIGAMQETVLGNIIIIEFSTVLFVFTATITNIIRLFNTKKNIKRKARMHKLASLMTKQNIATTHTNHTNYIEIKALVTDLYNLSVQDIIVNNNINIKKLYKSEVFLSLLNESATVTKDLGSFKNSFDILVANNYISTLEAATAKVVTFSVSREILELL